jgi:hypothetical protein
MRQYTQITNHHILHEFKMIILQILQSFLMDARHATGTHAQAPGQLFPPTLAPTPSDSRPPYAMPRVRMLKHPATCFLPRLRPRRRIAARHATGAHAQAPGHLFNIFSKSDSLN